MSATNQGASKTPARPQVKVLGATEYEDCHKRMREFTESRDEHCLDEIWLTSHPSVYTLGQSAKAGQLLRDNGIRLVRTDRGGQITYHGPGQAVAYVLVDLHRAGYGVRSLVRRLELATIALLEGHGIEGRRRDGMPGIYAGEAKIAALGLRVRRGCTYHGTSLNVDVDLAPFADMDTCGFKDLEDTSMHALGVTASCEKIAAQWGEAIADAIAGRC